MEPALLPIDPQALESLCRRYHITRLSLFGSQLKGSQRPDSDIDLLVEFEVGKVPGFLGLAAIQEELSALLAGRHIDLRTPQDLSPHFRAEILRTAEVQFAA